jgi:hypothetical protein
VSGVGSVRRADHVLSSQVGTGLGLLLGAGVALGVAEGVGLAVVGAVDGLLLATGLVVTGLLAAEVAEAGCLAVLRGRGRGRTAPVAASDGSTSCCCLGWVCGSAPVTVTEPVKLNETSGCLRGLW